MALPMKRYTELQRDLNTLYPVVDRVPYEQRKALGLSVNQGSPLQCLGAPCPGVHAKRTGEFREPRKGEWYLSGAFVEAYCAPNDLTTKFHIAVLVKTKTEMVEVTTEV